MFMRKNHGVLQIFSENQPGGIVRRSESEIFTVVNQQMNIPVGDGLYTPLIVIFGMVYYWVCHVTQIDSAECQKQSFKPKMFGFQIGTT